MNIYVKHKDDKLFEGTADISVIGRINGSSNAAFEKHIKTVDFIGSKKLVELNYKDELDITSPTSDIILTFNVKLTEKITQKSIEITKVTKMKFDVNHTIKITRREYFKPGFEFSIKYKFKKFNGNQEFVKEKEKVSVEYHNKNRKTGIETTTQEDKKIIIETNGKAFLLLNPTSEATKIVILCELFGLRQIETIYPLPVHGTKEYLHLNRLSSNFKLGDEIKFQVRTTGEMTTLHVLVIGLTGLVYKKEFPNAAGKNFFQFSFPFVNNMMPESRGIVFYVRPSDGVLIYDEFKINHRHGTKNYLQISVPKSSKANEPIDLHIETSEDALVFLTISDNISTEFGRQNEITDLNIYNELIYYLNLKFSNSSNFHFEYFNGFVMQPLQVGTSCDQDIASDDRSLKPDEEDQLNYDLKYFPDYWFDKSFWTKSKSTKIIDINLPNSLTTPRYYGISLHRTNGFAIANVNLITDQYKVITITVVSPSFASVNEVVWVVVTVCSDYNEKKEVEISLSIENGSILETIESKEFDLKCIKFQNKNVISKTEKMEVEGNKTMEVIKVPIRANGNGDIKVRVVDKKINTDEEYLKFLKILPVNEPKNTSEYFLLNAFRTDERNDHMKLDVKLSLNGTSAVTNLLVLEVELPRGFKFINHNLKENLLSLDVRNDRNLLVFYMKKLEKEQTITITASKIFEFSNHKSSMIKLYDYYRTNIMDSIYYVHDRREENCERIRVEHEIKKAENAQAVTNKANQITEEATNSVGRANSAINEADKKYKNADQNIQTAENKINSANSVVGSANHIVSEALRIAEDAAKIKEVRISSRYPSEQEVNENEEYPECYVDQVRRTRRTEEQETSEAIRKQEVADDKDKKLEIAECVASKAKINAKNAKNDASRKQKEADNARLKATEALEEVNNAKIQAESLRNEVTTKQREVNEELQKVKTGRTKVNNAKAVIESAQGKNAEVNQAVMTSKNNVQNSFTVTKNALTLAQNSYKAIEAQDSVTSASELASQTKLNAEVARRNASNAESRSSSALTGITQAETEVTHIREKVEQILHQTKEIKSRTEESKSKSKEANVKYRAAIKLTEDLQKQADEAEHKYQIANRKEKTKSEAEEQAKREAREARTLADEAREVEVQTAVDFASIAERDAEEAEELAKETANIVRNVEQEAQTTVNDRTKAAKILLDFKISNQATVSSEENHKMYQIRQKAKTAVEANKNAQEESQKARQAASEAQNAANNAKSTTDAIKTVENSRKASKEAENAKSAKEKTSAQKSIAEEAKNDCEEAKKIAVETKKCADAANNMNLLMKELNEEKSLIIEASKSAREAVKAAKLFLTEVKKIDSSQEINTAINELNAIDRSINTTIDNAYLAQKNVNSARIRGFRAFESAIKATDYNTAAKKSQNCESEKQTLTGERNKIAREKQNAENNKKSALVMKNAAELKLNEAEQTKIAEEIQKATQSEKQARIYSLEATQEATRVKDTQTDIQEVISNLENTMRLTDEATEPFGESRMESANLIKTDELGVTKIASKAAEDAQQAAEEAKKLAEDMKFVKKADEAVQKANEAKQNEENAKKAHDFAVDARRTANEAKKAVEAAKQAYEESLKVKEMFETILSNKKAIEDAINEAQTAMNEAIEYGATQNEVNKALITEKGKTTFEIIKLRTEIWLSEANNTKISSSKAVKEAYEAAKAAIKAENFETASEEVKNSIAAKEIVQNAQNSTVKPSKAFEYFSKIAETIKTKAIDIKVEAEKKKKLDVETKATRLASNANLEAKVTEQILNQIKDAKTDTDMAIKVISNAEKATKEAKGLAGHSKSGEESNDLSLIVEKANNATKSAEASVKKSKEAARNAQQAANDAKKAKDLKSTIEYANKVDEEKKSAMYARREAEKAKIEAEDAKRSALEHQTKAQNTQRSAEQARISQEKSLAEKSRNNTVQTAQTAETEAKKIDQAKKECENVKYNITKISYEINVLLDGESAPEVNRKIAIAIQIAQKATREVENAATNAAQQLKLARNSNRHANQQIQWNDKVADAIKIASTMKRAENSATQAMNAVSQFAKKAESAKTTADQAMQTALNAKADAENIRKEKEIEKANSPK